MTAGHRRDAGWLRWISVAVFLITPIAVTHAIARLGAAPTEAGQKIALLQEAGPIDTVIVGDSRVLRVSPDAFIARGWRLFNMGLSGMSPADVVMQLKYALDHAPIARVVLGVTFENMTEREPFEFSRYADDRSFASPVLVAFVNSGQPRPPSSSGAASLAGAVLPYARATDALHVLLERTGVETPPPPRFLPDGRAAYVSLQAQIAAGTYDYAKNRDVAIYAQRPDSEVRYLEHPVLAAHAQALYSRVFADLRARRIPTLAYETGRSAAYQRMLDENAVLHRLQTEWRAFYQHESAGCVRFVDAAALAPEYRDEDFFDAVHYLGDTEQRLGARLARELETLEATCR